MKRIVSIIFFLLISIFIAALIIPSFIDWNDHKVKIISKMENYLQRDIDIKGNISFHILPQPEIILEDVSISNISELSSSKFMTFKKIAASIKIAPLLEGNIEVDSIELINPVINFMISKNGVANWLSVFKDRPKKAIESVAMSIKLNKVNFIDTVIKYHNNTNGSEFNIKGLNILISAGSLLGPYDISGDMDYLNSNFRFNIQTKKYNKIGALPLNASFIANNNSNMPNIKFGGIVDFEKHFGAQGELSLNNGSIAALLPSLKDIKFLTQNSNFNSIVNIDGNNISLKDINAKISTNARLKGEISGSFYNNKKAFFTFNLEGKNLILSDKKSKGYIKTPSEFNGKINFKGRNSFLAGRKIPLVDFDSVFKSNEWIINYASLLLNDGSKIRLSGKIKPLENIANYNLKLSTKYFNKFINILDVKENNILKVFSDSGLVSGMDFNGKIKISSKKINIYNFNSELNKNKMKITGVLNIGRESSKPKFDAKISLFNWDANYFSKKSKDMFLKKLINSNAKIELTSKNLKGSRIALKNVYFNAEIKNKKLHINSFKGGVSKNEKFDIAGNINSLRPISGLDIYYNMSSIRPSSIAKLFGVDMPPMFFSWHNSSIKGRIKGSFKKYNFAINSRVKANNISLVGSKEKNIYNINLTIKNKKSADILKYMGVPVSSVFSDRGKFIFTGKLKGTGKKYSISNIKAAQGKSGFTGTIEKNDNLYSGKLDVTAFDIDKFINTKFSSKLNLNLNIKGKTLWGGKLSSNIIFNKKTNIAKFKGRIDAVKLNKLRKKIGFKGFSLGKGNIDFDLKSKKSKLSGVLNIKTTFLKLNGFNYNFLSKTLDELNKVPSNLKKIINRSLAKNGNGEFRNIFARFDVKGSQFKIRSLKLSNEYGDMNIEGFGNLKDGSYKINSKLSLKKPRKIPSFNIIRTSKSKSYSFDDNKIKKFIIVNNPPPLVVQSYVVPVNKAATALPPITEHKAILIKQKPNTSSSEVIGNILKSLEE